MKKIHLLPIAFAFLTLISCDQDQQEETESEAPLQEEIGQIQKAYAPDGRVALFSVDAEKQEDGIILKGETNMLEALDSLKRRLRASEVTFVDSVRVLPDTAALESKIMGVVPISVANLRDEPKHSAQLVTQVTLGMPLKVLKREGGWYYVQAPDGYLAWVDYGGIQNMTTAEFTNWLAAEKLIFTDTFGESVEAARPGSAMVGDLVAGDILQLEGENGGFYEVSYPNSKKAFIQKSQAKPYKDWLASLDQTEESLVKTSETLMGLPYLWGGTSSKGVDCSGFTKTVYFMNGFVLPRDASQQVHAGKLVDSTRNFKNLEPGDLLFFGRPATDSTSERVVHVGMWIGNDHFVHSMGEVHISNFDSTATDFDEYNYNRYLRSKRLLNEDRDLMLNLKDEKLFVQDSVR